VASTLSNLTVATRCTSFNNERVAFGPGDLLFVPAGVAHRFEQFSDDLLVWVLFYGPQGGEGSPAEDHQHYADG
jgi:mannose-6-phosphate isomerase-like protein (cupin superfamily)